MTAKDAKQLADSSKIQYKECLELIKDAAERGFYSCFYNNRLNKFTTDELKKLGYKINDGLYQCQITWEQ